MSVRMLIAVILVGLLSGVFYTAVQAVKVVPLILEAEVLERSGQNPAAVAASPLSADVVSGVERTLYSLLANCISGVAYSLLLMAAIVVSNVEISPRSGLIWGAAGFVVFLLAPSLGLPPELPGTAAATVEARQVWWLATVLLTAGGLALVAFKSRWGWWLMAMILLLAPHIYGAPQPAIHQSLVPANLAVEYVVAAIVSGGIFWLFLGLLLGWALPKTALGPEDKSS